MSIRPEFLLIAAMLCGGCEPAPAGPPALVSADDLDAFEEVRDCRFSVEHDAVYIRILAEPDVAAAYRDGVYPFPEGATIVKEEYRTATCDEPMAFTLMQRLAPEDDPQLGDWVWQRLDAQFRVLEIEAPRCVTCHTACTNGRDFVCADP